MTTKEEETSNFTKFWQRAKAYVDNLFGITFRQVVLDELPEVGEFKTVYFIPSSNPSSENTYDEFLWVAASGDDPTDEGYIPAHFEQVGSTAYVPDHTIDTTSLAGKVVITKDEHSFAVNAEEIVKPAAPTLPTGGDFYNSKSITITAASGAVIYYTTDGSIPTTASARYTSAFTIGSTASQSTSYTIKAIAVKNGMTSDVASQTYTCYRRVATPTATASGNKYSSSRTITFACSTADATIEYKVGSGEWTEGGSVTINATSTVYFRAKKSDWVTSAEDSKEYTLNAPKCYIGGAGASLSSLSGLTGVEADNLNGERIVTLASANYIWFVVPSGSSITSITSGPLAVPFALIPNSVSGYNCYRTDLEITAGTYTYNIA